VFYDTAISLPPSGSGQTARGRKQMFCTYFKCTAHVRPRFCTQFVDTGQWQCHHPPRAVIDIWRTNGGRGPPLPQSPMTMTPPATTANGTRKPRARRRWRAAGLWTPRQRVRLLWEYRHASYCSWSWCVLGYHNFSPTFWERTDCVRMQADVLYLL
jgi:hypothetical protein